MMVLAGTLDGRTYHVRLTLGARLAALIPGAPDAPIVALDDIGATVRLGSGEPLTISWEDLVVLASH